MKNFCHFKKSKNAIKTFFVIVLSLTIFMMFSCSYGRSAIDLNYFHTIIHIETHDKTLDNGTLRQLKEMFSALENQFSLSSENSLLNKINKSKKGEIIPLTAEQTSIFSSIKYCYDYTEKAFNPAIYPLAKLWQFAPSYPIINFTVPTEKEISDTLIHTDFSKITLDKTNNQLIKNEDFLSLDTGGILKGYASDKAGEILKNNGFRKGYINIGGSSLALFDMPSLSIRHPRATKEKQEIIKINTENDKFISVSTSGDYEKYYVADGKRYCHIIDSKTGKPIDTGVASVTITGVDGIISDALTTALCTMSYSPENQNSSELIKFMKKILADYKNASIYAVYINEDYKQILTNEKENDNFVLLDSDFTVINIY